MARYLKRADMLWSDRVRDQPSADLTLPLDLPFFHLRGHVPEDQEK